MQFFERIWNTRNYRIAIVFSGLMLLWLASGLVLKSGAETAPEPENPSLTSVKARHVDAESYALSINVRARTEANRDVDLRAEVSGQVIALPAAKGSLVKTGDVICELALEDRQLRLSETQAEVEKSQLEYDGALRLKSGGYQSRTAIAGAKARLETAKANLKRRQLDLENLKIRAPFDGVVDDRPVEVGDLVERGDICATVLDLDPLVVSGRLSEAEVGRLVDGGEATAALITGETVTGKIRFISRSSDEITRTFRVEVAVPNSDLKLRSGTTTKLTIPTGKVAAHLISAALLALDDAGRIGVRVLDEQHRVQFKNVQLIGDHPRGVWVAGLPERVLLITVGQEYVHAGELVAVSIENLDQSSGMSAAQL